MSMIPAGSMSLRRRLGRVLIEVGVVGPFPRFLARAERRARRSEFRQRYPFALERGPAAQRLHVSDPNNRFGHEPELAHLIDLLVPEDGVFLDVGANVGYFSIYLACRTGFRGRIHAFEPIPRAFSALRENVDALGCSDVVICHQAAVSAGHGTANMQTGADLGLSRIAADPGGEVVKTVSLDGMGLDRADFIKIDVEGHEAEALKGADALLRSSAPFVFLESWSFAERPNKVLEPLSFLQERGYELYLPAWGQPKGALPFVGIGPAHEMRTFLLLPFVPEDRMIFPGNPINIFAASRERGASLGQ